MSMPSAAHAAMAATSTTTATAGDAPCVDVATSPKDAAVKMPTYAPIMKTSLWAKLMSPSTPYTMV